MTRLFLIVALMAQSGCVGAAIYGELRKVVRQGVTAAVPAALPGLPVAEATDCVVKGLTQVELVSLPNSGTFDDQARAQAFVTSTAARPAVQACLAALPRAAG